MRTLAIKRLLTTATISLVIAVAAKPAVALATGVFNGGLGQTDSVASGTLTLSSNVTGACNATAMLPGSAPAPCTLAATFSGSAPAYLGVDITVETQAGIGGTPLYNPGDAAHDLQVAITSTTPSVTYTVPATSTTCPNGAPGGSTCYELDDELLSTSAFAAAPPSSSVTFSTTASLPSGATTGYRGGSAQVIERVHAAQAAYNSTGGCTAGTTCLAVTWN